MKTVVHFVPLDGGSFLSVCGKWDQDFSWTTERAQVTCPVCERRLVGTPFPRPTANKPAAQTQVSSER